MDSDKIVILVTGSSGVVGHALKDIVKDRGCQNEEFVFVSSKDARLENYEETQELFKRVKPTYLIHLAAKYCGIYTENFSNLDNFLINDKINVNILQCAHQFKVKKVVCCLSGMVFSHKNHFPVNEDSIQTGPISGLLPGYVYSKRLLEIYCRVYNECSKDMLCLSVIMPNVYGPNDFFDLKSGRVVPSLIYKTFISKNDGTPLKILGTGKAMRQFIFSYDAARFILEMLFKYQSTEPIIMTSKLEDEISILELAMIIKKSMNHEQPIEFDTSFGDGMIRRTMLNDRLKAHFPNFKFTSVEEGINKTVKWFIENFENIKK